MMVAMVEVREVRVAVAERRVHVQMAVWLAGRRSRLVDVLVVLVMDVGMHMFERVVLVLVVMPLGEMKPHAGPHEDCSEQGLPGQRLVERDGARDCSDEGRRREVGARSGGAQEAKSQHEENQAGAVSQEADNARAEDGGRGRPRSLLDYGQ